MTVFCCRCVDAVSRVAVRVGVESVSVLAAEVTESLFRRNDDSVCTGSSVSRSVCESIRESVSQSVSQSVSRSSQSQSLAQSLSIYLSIYLYIYICPVFSPIYLSIKLQTDRYRTHTHTHRERERERKRNTGYFEGCRAYSCVKVDTAYNTRSVKLPVK